MPTDHSFRDKLLEIALIDRAEISEDARSFARLSLFDWLTVGLAGRTEPVAEITTEYVKGEGAEPKASVFGGVRTSARLAALANGTISHALDYDDTHFAHVGHLSVAIYPAALAALETREATIADLIDTFVIGAEAACRFGMSLGAAHYHMGFHQTATSGAIGATIASARAMDLSPEKMATALSLVATKASGLKSQFGTMGKPFNAGIAAANGVEAAALARLGITAPDDGLYGSQGFAETHGCPVPDATAFDNPPPGNFVFTENKYKLHACCHGLHALIGGLSEAVKTNGLGPEDIIAIRIKTNPRWLTVCDIKAPRTGLEVKFSYAWLAALVATGHNTTAETTYTDACAKNPKLAKIARLVTVTGDETLPDTASMGTVKTNTGQSIPFKADIAESNTPQEIAEQLKTKANALLGAQRADDIQTALNSDKESLLALAHLLQAEPST